MVSRMNDELKISQRNSRDSLLTQNHKTSKNCMHMHLFRRLVLTPFQRRCVVLSVAGLIRGWDAVVKLNRASSYSAIRANTKIGGFDSVEIRKVIQVQCNGIQNIYFLDSKEPPWNQKCLNRNCRSSLFTKIQFLTSLDHVKFAKKGIQLHEILNCAWLNIKSKLFIYPSHPFSFELIKKIPDWYHKDYWL